MLTVRVEKETIEGVSGIRLRTNAEPGTEAEGRLQGIQSELSGGIVDLPSPTTLPHLNFYVAAIVDGPDKTYISLWVPSEQQLQATRLLEDAGFALANR
jgi:hypothetical protein